MNISWNIKIKLFTLNIAVFILLVLIAGCSKSNNSNPIAPQSSTNQVVMQNSSFVPSSNTITAGTKVTWTNKDSYAHTVTSGTPSHPTGLFDSGNINAGGTFSYTFDSTGTYQYYCKIHPDIMQGTVTVK